MTATAKVGTSIAFQCRPGLLDDRKASHHEHIATVLAELMTLLGYERFAVQGGDVGAGVATWLAHRFPARVRGVHLNYIPGSYAPPVGQPPSDEEAAFLTQRRQWGEEQGAYAHVQRTRPLTLGYALSDSPAGLAAWIVEKFREWADPRSSIPIDTILTNVTLDWATNTIASSMRLYFESARTPLRFAAGQRVTVPCGGWCRASHGHHCLPSCVVRDSARFFPHDFCRVADVGGIAMLCTKQNSSRWLVRLASAPPGRRHRRKSCLTQLRPRLELLAEHDR